MSNITYGIMFAVVAVLCVIGFGLNLKAMRRWSALDGLSKVLATIIACLALGGGMAFGYFSFENLTYKAPQTDELTKQLQKQIEEVKQTTTKYTQLISDKDYMNLSTDELYARYSKEGQKDVDNLSKESTLTKDLFLRNVGRHIKPGGLFTTGFKATNGKAVDLLDGKNRIILFVDTTDYSAEVIKAMRTYIKDSRLEVELVLFFPVTSGTDIDAFFANKSDYTGPQNQAIIVSADSINGLGNLDVKYIAVEEYRVQNLPSYVAIDSSSVVSNVGVGTLIASQEDAAGWFNKAFTSESRYYERIEVASTDQEAGTDTDQSTTESSSEAATTAEADTTASETSTEAEASTEGGE